MRILPDGDLYSTNGAEIYGRIVHADQARVSTAAAYLRVHEVALSDTDEAVRALAIDIRQPSDVRRHGPLSSVLVGEPEGFERPAARRELDAFDGDGL